jgi:hypothetical protein
MGSLTIPATAPALIEGIQIDVGNMSAVAILVVVFFMVMRGTLATPPHQKDLRDRITYLEGVVKDQRDAVKGAVQNARTVEQVGQVVEHTMGAISQKAAE